VGGGWWAGTTLRVTTQAVNARSSARQPAGRSETRAPTTADGGLGQHPTSPPTPPAFASRYASRPVAQRHGHRRTADGGLGQHPTSPPTPPAFAIRYGSGPVALRDEAQSVLVWVGGLPQRLGGGFLVLDRTCVVDRVCTDGLSGLVGGVVGALGCGGGRLGVAVGVLGGKAPRSWGPFRRTPGNSRTKVTGPGVRSTQPTTQVIRHHNGR